jgi:two-component system, LuxR family, sensor histidine kinase DctS
LRQALFRAGKLLTSSRRFQLWLALASLVLVGVGMLVFLTARYEASQWQSRADADAAEAVHEVRLALSRHVQQLQAMQNTSATAELWESRAIAWLFARKELRTLEWRDAKLTLITRVLSPFSAPSFASRRDSRETPGVATETWLACNAARRNAEPSYSTSYFQPDVDGQGAELMELCVPWIHQGRVTGYTVAVVSLRDLLSEAVSGAVQRGQSISFTEADGSRLATIGQTVKGFTRFVGNRLLDLQGNTLVVRVERAHEPPGALPNVLVTSVSLLSIALLVVLGLLLMDMRRRQVVETELAQALAFRKAMEDSLRTGLRARDLHGRITYVNPAFCQMVGYSAAELVGSASPAPYWPSERVAEYQARQAKRFSSGRLLDELAQEGFESEFIRQDGTHFPVLIIEAPLIDAKGAHQGWMSAVIDISEKRRAEAALRQREDRLQAASRLATVGEMASLISHELNQPLAAISSYAEGAINIVALSAGKSIEDSQNDAKNGFQGNSAMLEEALQRIAVQAARAGRVIRSVNDFVRQREQQRETVSAQALLDAAMPLMQLQARKAGAHLVLVCANDLPLLACNRTLVEQVLLNLARNGMQAMDAPDCARRELRIEVRRQDERWAAFRVADTGPGIDPEAARHVFTEFFTTKRDGMGLGLSLCRSVIEQHGGALRHEALVPQGTAFVFTLPFADAEIPPSP